jgi:hypothetical protein
VACILLLASVGVPAASAQTVDPNPAGDQWIRGVLAIEQPDMATFEIEASFTLLKYVLKGTSYKTADDMGDAYQQVVQADAFARASGQTSNRADAFVDDIEKGASDSLRSTLARSFPGATVTVGEAVVDRTTLGTPSGDPYAPGVQVALTARVARPLADLGLGDLSLAAIDAAFAAGATVSSDITLSASAGQDLTFLVSPPARPAGLAFEDVGPSPLAKLELGALVVEIDNSRGATADARTAAFKLVDPVARAAAPDHEDIGAAVEIRLGSLEKGATSLPVEADFVSQVHAIDVAKRFPGALPDKVKLAFLSADGLRALRQSGAISEADLATADEQLRATLSDQLRDFLPDAKVTGGLSQADLARAPAKPFRTDPPVPFGATATGHRALPAGAEDADLALRIGAVVNVDLDVPASKDRETRIAIKAPQGMAFSAAQGATLSADKSAATLLVPADPAQGSRPVKLSLRDPAAPAYTAEKADLAVVVDLKDLDISIGKAIGGDLGELVVEVTVTGKLGVIKVPDDVKASLGGSLELSYLDSDAIRLLRERGILGEENLTKLEAELMEQVKKNLGSALGADVVVTGGLDRASLDPKLVSSPLSGDKPVLFKAQTSFRKSLSGAPAPQAAIALYTQQQTFDLPKVQGLDTAYTVILPYGLAVTDLQVEGGEKETGTSEDGRDQFTVRPEGESAKATVSMAVTPSFVVAKFWPLLLVVAMVLILLIGSPIAFVVMRRRRKGKGGEKPAAEAPKPGTDAKK